MDLVLSFLKFGGIILSGILGILTTLTQTHEEVGADGKKKLNRWGKCAFTLTILGFTTALGAQLAEVIQKQHEEAESRKRTEKQIQQANEVLSRLEEQGFQAKTILTNLQMQGKLAALSLNGVERIVTRFDTFSVSFTYELDSANAYFIPLCEFAEHLLRSSPLPVSMPKPRAPLAVENKGVSLTNGSSSAPSGFPLITTKPAALTNFPRHARSELTGFHFITNKANSLRSNSSSAPTGLRLIATQPAASTLGPSPPLVVGDKGVSLQNGSLSAPTASSPVTTPCSDVWSMNIVGCVTKGSNTFTINYPTNLSSIVYGLPNRDIVFTKSISHSMSDEQLERVVALLYEPHFSVSIYAPQTRDLTTPDFCVLATNLVSSPEITYQREPKKLLIKWSISCPKSSWEQTKRMLALPDLANAKLYFAPLAIPPAISGGLNPVGGELTFDLTTISMALPEPVASRDGAGMMVKTPDNLSFTWFNYSITNDMPPYNMRHLVAWNNVYRTILPSEEEFLGHR
jgi:hypothetical protein